MEKTAKKYSSHEAMKADEIRYWQSRPVHERMEATRELTKAADALKGIDVDGQKLQGPVVRVPRPLP